MISPELLRRYPFFACLDEAQLVNIAMDAEQVICERGATLFDEGMPVAFLHFLLEGRVELYYAASGDENDEARICEIAPGEPFAISALIEPYTLTATARASARSRLLKFDAARLRAQCESDPRLGYALMCRIARVSMERLHNARIQLAAAPA